MNRKAAAQRHVHQRVSGARQNVAAGISKRVRLWIRERIAIEPVVGAPLTGRQVHILAGDHIATIRRSTVRKIRPEVDRVERRSILERENRGTAPVREYLAQETSAAEVIDDAGAEPAPDVEYREASLQAKVALVLSPKALAQAGDDGVGVVDGFRPHEAREERQFARETFFALDLERMVRRIGDVLDLINRAEIGERPQRLEVAGTWRQVLAGLDVRRRIEGAEAAEVRSLAADVGRFDQ